VLALALQPEHQGKSPQVEPHRPRRTARRQPEPNPPDQLPAPTPATPGRDEDLEPRNPCRPVLPRFTSRSGHPDADTATITHA
jgi:hypothetical protein